MKHQVIQIPLGDLVVSTYVRERLNTEWAIQLGIFLEEGQELPPIEVTKVEVLDKSQEPPRMVTKYEIIDGRHRNEAHKMALRKTIGAIVIDVKDTSDKIVKAFMRNTGGPLPPTMDDIRHTIGLLIDENMSQKDIAGNLNLPLSIVRKMISTIHSQRNRARLERAIRMVVEDEIKPQTAAEKCGVDLQKLKAALKGKKKDSEDDSVVQMKTSISATYRSFSQKIGQNMRKISDMLDEGDILLVQAEEFLDLVEKHQKQNKSAIEDWRGRLAQKRISIEKNGG